MDEPSLPALSIAFITVPSPEYKAACELRDGILRRPLGLHLSQADTKDDHNQWHLGGFINNTLVGCVSAAKTNLQTQDFQIRQMAISDAMQGYGLGKRLMQFMETHLQSHGCKRIHLAARVTAQGFYERLGYVAISGVFIHNTLPHITMEKHF
ncbi:MAG: GNAT family N-acetyltransferase [Gammaproteobacteria bacterium]|nr:GNAT family N-acetyltransferase [Gammaproteobacteria bacterium]